MPVSANATLNFTRDQIITMAYQYAQLVPSGSDPTADEIAMASNFFNLELMTLQAEGVVLRTVERTTLSLVAGTATYSLPTDVIDVQQGPNGQMGTIVPTSGAESTVLNITRTDYLSLAQKSSPQGRPTQVLLEKFATLQVTFWPVPDSTSASFRYAKVRLLKDMDTGTVTTDLARRWLQAVTYAVASQVALAKSQAMELVGFLRGEAERLKDICRADDVERGPMMMRVAHSGRRW